MRLLWLTEGRVSFGEPSVRGSATVVRNLVTGFRDRGHEAVLVDWNRNPERPFQHSVSPWTRLVDGTVRTARKAVAVGREVDVDAIVSTSPRTYIPGLYAARKVGAPHVAHVHASLDRRSGRFDRVGETSLSLRLRAPHDAYFVAASFIGRQLAHRRVEPARLFDVKTAVDTDLFHPGRVPSALEDRYQRRIDAVDDEALRLGYVGDLHPDAGLADFREAIGRAERLSHAVVAGEGPAREDLESAFGRFGTFLGSIPDRQLPAFYHELDLLVVPARRATPPTALLEAAATATPVVATSVDGLAEPVTDGETGLLVDPGDPGGLAAAIDRLGRDPGERERLGDNARATVVDDYTWDALYDRYQLYLSNVIP